MQNQLTVILKKYEVEQKEYKLEKEQWGKIRQQMVEDFESLSYEMRQKVTLVERLTSENERLIQEVCTLKDACEEK